MLFSRDDLKRLLVPLLLEQFLVVLIGLMDTVMVSSCGEASISGVSLVDSINVLLIGVFSALATGGAVLTSQYLGQQNRRDTGKAAKLLFYVILMFSTFIMLVCLLFGGPLLSVTFGTIEPEVMEAARIYFILSALSYPFMAMYNGACALLRATGNARQTLYVSFAMNLINIVGNAVTIYLFKWGVFGAGLATLISRAAGAVVTQIALRKPDCGLPTLHLLQWEWDGCMVRKILSVGVPSGFENGLFQLGKLLLVRMISNFGTPSITANAVGNTLGSFQCLPGNAIGLAMITVVGQCCGARQYDQARHYTKRLMQLAYLCMSIENILMLLCNPIITLPFNLTPETNVLARQIVAIHGAGCVLLWPMSFVLPNALRASGDAQFTMGISVFSMMAFRILFGWLLAIPAGMGVIGVWCAMQIDWVFRIVCFVRRWHSGMWETKTLV